MDISDPDFWKNIFTEKQKCDFCERDDALIMKTIVLPIFKQGIGDVAFAGVVYARKCWKCCEK